MLSEGGLVGHVSFEFSPSSPRTITFDTGGSGISASAFVRHAVPLLLSPPPAALRIFSFSTSCILLGTSFELSFVCGSECFQRHSPVGWSPVGASSVQKLLPPTGQLLRRAFAGRFCSVISATEGEFFTSRMDWHRCIDGLWLWLSFFAMQGCPGCNSQPA